MYNTDTKVLFPERIIQTLRNLRGNDWETLIDRVTRENCDKLERYGFVLLMVRMSGCTSCNADSFRAMRGCMQCAKQSVKRFRGADKELLDQHKEMVQEIQKFLDQSK